jgi:hypothetical protein
MKLSADPSVTAPPRPVESLGYASPETTPAQPQRRPVFDWILVMLWLAAVVALFSPFGSHRAPIMALAGMISEILTRGIDFGDALYGLFVLPMLLSVACVIWHALVIVRPSRPVLELRILRMLSLAGACVPLSVLLVVFAIEVPIHQTSTTKIAALLTPFAVAGAGLATIWAKRREAWLRERLALLLMATAYATPATYLTIVFAVERAARDPECVLFAAGVLAWGLEMLFVIAGTWRAKA